MTLVQIRSGAGRGGARMGPTGPLLGRSSSNIGKKFRALSGVNNSQKSYISGKLLCK